MKALCIVIGIFLLATAQVEAQEREYAPGQIILSFKNKEDAVLEMSEGRMTCMFSTVMSILERYEATWMRRLYSGNKGAQNMYLIELSSDTHVNPAIAEFRNDPAIKSSMRNYAIEFLAQPNDWYFNNDYIPPGYPLVEDQWYLKVMQADKAWDVSRKNANIRIGILDTGIDFFHQDLSDNI